MNKNRLLALLVALCMVFALFACGDEYFYEDDDDDDDDDDEGTSQTTEGTDPTGDNTDPTGDNTDPTGGQDNNESVTPNPGTPVLPPDSGNNDDNTQQPTPNPNTPSPSPNDPNPNPGDNDDPLPNPDSGNDSNPGIITPAPPAADTILGSWSGNTYINKYLGFRVAFPDTWDCAPVDSSVDPENPFPNSSTVQITDLEASTDGGNSISVIYQNPNAYNGGINASNTEEQNINLILAESDALYDVYEGMG